MAKKVALDYFNTEITNFKVEDLQKKLDIVSNVLKQCQLEGKSVENPSEIKQASIAKCSKLTGVDQETLLAVELLEERSIKFDEWLFEQKQMIHGYNYEYSSIKKLLLESYTQKLEVPTGVTEKKEFEGCKKNFTFLKLPGTDASIIVEKPETVQERCRFLHTKKMYREMKNNIVYIGKVNLLMNHGKISYKEDTIDIKSRFIIAASPTLGHVGYIYCCGNNQEFITNWIEEKIIPELPKGSLIIFQENVLDSVAEIDSFTSKVDMIFWLKSNKVSHDPKMHRAELFKLIKNIKQGGVEQLSTTEENLRAHGHIILRKKKCNLNNNYFDPFWDFLIHELNAASASLPPIKYSLKNQTHAITRTVNVIVQNVTLDYWENLDTILLKKEQEISKEDMEMEIVIDNLMTMVKYEGLSNGVSLDEYSQTMKQPNMFLTDNLRNLYKQSTIQSYRGLNISK